ncbi:MAG: XdhC family protein [Bacteroidota bacterium]
MKDLLPTWQSWLEKGEPFALATVIKTWGSGPRPVGSQMLMSADMEMAGSVSGGCVEGAVLRASQEVLASGTSQMLKYGVTDDEAWSVGLSCGGKIEVFLEKVEPEMGIWQDMVGRLEKEESFVRILPIQTGPSNSALLAPDGLTIGAEISTEVKEAALKAYQERHIRQEVADEVPYLLHVVPRRSQLLIVGAAHITVDLVHLAKFYGFETTVIDPRGIFAEKTQFLTQPDQLHIAYPEEVLDQYPMDPYTYAVILSHDPKIDDNALHVLLKEPVAYIGALGSKRTHAKRVARLTEAGFSEDEIARIHAPIGLNIGAKSPREIALSIMAELVATQHAYSKKH